MKKIQIVVGSVRPIRIGDQIGRWILGVAEGAEDFTFELVDIKDFHLPMDDEPDQPAHGEYTQEHTRVWSRKISDADGYVFLTPQYNWGYPASLKNALDHLYREWKDKPAVIISYGHRGGVRASAQLRQVLDGLHMRTAATMPSLFIAHDMFGPDHRLMDPAAHFSDKIDEVREALSQMVDLFTTGGH